MSISVIGGSCFTGKELKLHQLVSRARSEDGSSISMEFWNKKLQGDLEVEDEPNMSLAYWNKKVEEELEEKRKKVSLLREEMECIEDGTLLRMYKDPTDEEDSNSTNGGRESFSVMDICSFSTFAIGIVIVIIIFALIVKYSKYVNGKS